MPPPLTLDDLRARVAAGEAFSFLPFWGHRERKGGGVGPSCFSQWYPATFEVDGARYPSAEHFMMAEKARLFGDDVSLAKILAAPTPDKAKALGRRVAGYDDARWAAHRFEAVVRGNEAKFAQNPPLARFLLATAPQVLVEASPVDAIWGIGLAAADPRTTDPAQWAGLNLLGFALMRVRDRLAR